MTCPSLHFLDSINRPPQQLFYGFVIFVWHYYLVYFTFVQKSDHPGERDTEFVQGVRFEALAAVRTNREVVSFTASLRIATAAKALANDFTKVAADNAV